MFFMTHYGGHRLPIQSFAILQGILDFLILTDVETGQVK